VAGCCECGDEPSGSCATELVRYFLFSRLMECVKRHRFPHRIHPMDVSHYTFEHEITDITIKLIYLLHFVVTAEIILMVHQRDMGLY
jgi:hypothetical protein